MMMHPLILIVMATLYSSRHMNKKQTIEVK